MLNRFNVFSTYAGLPREIYILFVTRVITAFGTFVVPFLSLFLTVKLGVGKEVAGIYVTLASVAYIPGALMGGKLSDKFSKKRVLMIAQGLSAVCLLATLTAGNAYVKILLIIGASVFVAASYPAIDALVAEVTTESQRKSAYSLMYIGLNLGCAVGPLAAGFLFYHYTNWLFLGDALTTLLSVALLAYLVRRPATAFKGNKEPKHTAAGLASGGSVLRILLGMPLVLVFAVISTFYAFAYSQYGFSLPLYLESLFRDQSSYFFGWLLTLNGLGVIVFTPVVAKLTERLMPVQNMVIAGAFYGVGFGLYYVSTQLVWCMLATLIWTLGEILYCTNFTVHIVNKSPAAYRGRVVSVSTIVSRMGFFLGPALMGGFINIFGVRQVWPLVFVVMAVSTLAMLCIYMVETKRQAVPEETWEEAKHAG